eukprot:TRINITY_DN433_c0_g1_i1.p1 TRINITY_DN433_c0_g1~~TRINITY_DN433_c0_g1_i1.p1  ORF type:complete len:498 (+),score=72.74 TRINITY_DN433_c0_g1_i1:7421-8914(+)
MGDTSGWEWDGRDGAWRAPLRGWVRKKRSARRVYSRAHTSRWPMFYLCMRSAPRYVARVVTRVSKTFYMPAKSFIMAVDTRKSAARDLRRRRFRLSTSIAPLHLQFFMLAMQAFNAPVPVVLSRTQRAVCERSRPLLPARFAPSLAISTPERRTSASRPSREKKKKSRRGINVPQSNKRVPTFKRLQIREHVKPTGEQQSQRHQSKKNKKREITLNYSDIFVGKKLNGVVRNNVPHGTYINVGTERDGLVHLRDMSVDFVHFPSDVVREGDSVTVWVKYVDPIKKILGLTMVKPHLGFESRMRVNEIEINGRYQGIIERITNYGAYVDIGAERQAFLHVTALWGDCQRDTLDYLRLGQEVWVHIADLDIPKSHIRLWARAVDGRELTETNDVSPVSLQPETFELRPLEVPRPTRRSWEPEPTDDEESETKEQVQEQSDVEDDIKDENIFDDEEFSFAEEPYALFEEKGLSGLKGMKGMEEIAHMFNEDTEFVSEEGS